MSLKKQPAMFRPAYREGWGLTIEELIPTTKKNWMLSTTWMLLKEDPKIQRERTPANTWIAAL